MRHPSISIVTPCLNARTTISETLASVRSQDFAAVEHIVIDGGSTDGTIELLAEDPRVRWISEPDRGLSHAFNKGVAMATGDVIGWLNADDVYLPGALEAVAEAFAAEPDREWATGRCAIIDATGAQIRAPVVTYKSLFLRRYSLGLHLVQNFVAAPSTFVLRSVLDELGGLDERFKYSMDYDLWLKLGRRGPPARVDGTVAAFRMGEGSLSMSGFERQFEEHALNAREHGEGHRAAVLANQLISRLIVVIYRALRRFRSARS